MKKTLFAFIAGAALFFFFSCEEEQSPDQLLQQDALEQLQSNLYHQPEWLKVHAAEFLIDLGKPSAVDSIFKLELKEYGHYRPYRIGIWRVLSQVDADAAQFIQKIIDVARDTSATDQLHAIETLAKRSVAPNWLNTDLKKFIIKNGDARLRTYTQWALAHPNVPGESIFMDSLRTYVHSKQLDERKLAALAIFKLNTYPSEAWANLAKKTLGESLDSKAKIFLLAAALRTSPERQSETYQLLKTDLKHFARSERKVDRYFFCETLAQIGTEKDLKVLSDLLYNKYPIRLNTDPEKAIQWNADVSAAAAYAILKIKGR